ncbi:glutamate decarboxylase 2 [Hyphopichia burtonii NRRL Y-1933]|uniref:Glutamate decarboxylase 2 n=1 Tax=Hyphopichia burtonii NRRL Y-1933 TaxID=984485 RepID=A0A1E4RI75_9ASCO|nr:glutamate decarboxylase 2 [Hyphopichia burtonii NRRL Y-1933]ODV66978.1 glutamate decarboxylase 2 [Hyphopichia burtonii NRRL Y-1933]
MTVIKSELESNRVQEIDDLLKLIHPKIIEYVEKSDPKSANYELTSLGQYHRPQTLKEIITEKDEEELVEGIRGDNDKLFAKIDQVFKYSVNTWNPGFLDKLYASNNPIGVISDIILSLLNTNSHVYTVSPVLSVIENYIGRKYASLFFTNDTETCGGLTFPGGSWSNTTSLHTARSLLYPETKETGNGSFKFAVFASEHCHYSVVKAAILMGLGSSNVFKVKILADGSMDTKDLSFKIEESKKQGFTPLYINSTAGTTVFGSYDPFDEIADIAEKNNIWFHIDGSWGGNVIFSSKHKYKMNGCERANSISCNPHKMLGVPNTCSFLLLPHVLNFQKAMSLSAPYLFHGRDDEGEENFDLADGTMGCGRRADSFKFYMAWLYYGFKGLEERVDHAFDIARDFIFKISQDDRFELVLGSKDDLPKCLQVCFYYRPKNYKLDKNTEITRFISRELHKRSKYLVDFSPNTSGGDSDKGEFFRVVFNSPILTDTVVDDLISSIIQVGEEFDS